MGKYVMALDQGTTSSRCILFDKNGRAISMSQKEFRQIYPEPGWVEHDAEEIFTTQLEVAREALEKADACPGDVDSIGITNQRETTVLWDRKTGKPLHNAIVWQCRRTAAYCDELKARGLTEFIQKRTGLLIDAYFSATKLKWILDHVPGAREKAKQGDLLFGTVETWLMWKLSGGKIHVTDYSNASRTMMFNIHTLDWDPEILSILDIPRCILPEPSESSRVYGETSLDIFGDPVKISGAAGDQQAALFGQTCFQPGEIKSTYGTGGFLLMNIGDQPLLTESGLLTTIAWGLNGRITYALEGSIFIAGAAIQWLRDELGIIKSSSDAEAMATSVMDNGGVYMVPAFVGLGAPYWDQYARGAILGITRGTNSNHLIRAALESIAYQNYELLNVMEKDSGITIPNLKVDGGASANNFLMQFQADLLGVPVIRPCCTETTALGAAYLAGLATGFWKNREDVLNNWQLDKKYDPCMESEEREKLLKGWHKAVRCSLGWAE
mgnify:FL=1